MSDLILRKMNMIALDEEGELITREGEHPPCFETQRQYDAWLESVNPETGSPPPTRKGWPGEPNYCRDCTRDNRNRMRNAGRCLFPNTFFIEVGDSDEDKEIVGVDR